jgi:hypothetical protein
MSRTIAKGAMIQVPERKKVGKHQRDRLERDRFPQPKPVKMSEVRARLRSLDQLRLIPA